MTGTRDAGVRLAAPAAAAALVALPLLASCADGAGPPSPRTPPEPELLFRVDGLAGPESVARDSLRGRWLVTNAGDGRGGARGFVTAVYGDGDSVARKAYDGSVPGLGLEAPRGIAVRGDRAYVVDGQRVVAVDLADDALAFELRIPESRRLEDVAVDPRGILYASDPAADAVFRVAPDGSGWERISAAGSLRGPDGLLVEAARPEGPDRVLTTSREGAVVAVNPDSSVALLAEFPGVGALDGIQRSPAGGLVVSEPSAGRLLLFRPDAPTVWRNGIPWLQGLRGPADILVHGRILAVPETEADRVSFYRLPDEP